MMIRHRFLFAAVSLIISGFGSCDAAVAQLPASTLPTAAEIRSLELTDQDGAPFKLGDAIGRTMVLNFIFTGCGDTCPTQTTDLAAVQHQIPPKLRSRVIFISISVDPEHDIPGTLRQYGDERQVDFAIARFLTGPAAAIERIAAFYGARRPPGAAAPAPTQHDTAIQLIDAHGQGRMRYGGVPVDTARLAQDIASFTTPFFRAR